MGRPRRYRWLKKTIVDCVIMLLIGFGLNRIADKTVIFFVFMVMSSCYVMLLIWVAMPFMELGLADAVSRVLMELAVYDDDNFKRIVIITFCCVFVVLRAEVHY